MERQLLSGSYLSQDVTFLLKEITGLITEKSNEVRENAIQNGVHYSEMLPIEYHPTEEYMKIFYNTLEDTKAKLARLVAILSKQIIDKRGKKIVLVSLARAGTPIGILIKRYLKANLGIELPHYSISIIRDIGIDYNAIKYILEQHPNSELQFIDGWTGKGVIQSTLIKACEELMKDYGIKLDPTLAVLSDPAYCTDLFGTREDFLIASACLNSTVSGLMSRTVFNKAFINKDDFHGAKFYSQWKDIDVSNYFVDKVTENFPSTIDEISIDSVSLHDNEIKNKGLADIKKIQELFSIENINLVKPGVGETTRVLLRRIPWKILVDDFNNPNLKHILQLSKEREVPVEVYRDMSYSCCGIIKPKGLGDV